MDENHTIAALQARIDALMLEYCPDEMTAEQVAEWARHQRPASDEVQAAFATITRKNKELRMNSKQFRAVLDWRMCSDPWPGGDEETVDEWLNEMARAFGFEHWIQAYHELGAQQ